MVFPFPDISLQRLYSQQLIDVTQGDIESVVSHFGAMQSQDYAMAKWGIGVRLPGIRETDVDEAFDLGIIVRTHVLRPTWHFTAAQDIHWMLQLTAKNVRRVMGTNDRKLGLDSHVFKKSFKLIEKALGDGGQLTRLELMDILEREKINTSEYRSSHIMAAAELESLVISGARKGNSHTYALLEERVKKPKKLNREEGLAELARTYFTSHGPATLKDYMWWSGLSTADAKAGIAANGSVLKKREQAGKEYWFSEEAKEIFQKSVQLLPAFDEFLIGYADRSASIEAKFGKHAFSNNGIFRPVVVIDGQVCGIWKRSIKKDEVTIEIQFLDKIAKSRYKEIKLEAQQYADFLGCKLSLDI